MVTLRELVIFIVKTLIQLAFTNEKAAETRFNYIIFIRNKMSSCNIIGPLQLRLCLQLHVTAVQIALSPLHNFR